MPRTYQCSRCRRPVTGEITPNIADRKAHKSSDSDKARNRMLFCFYSIYFGRTMIPSDFDLYKMQDAVRCGGIGDLRFACDFADCIVQAALKAGDQETLRSGFAAYRARNDYIEDPESEPGNIHIHPHIGEEISAPPKDKTRLGRFNAPLRPVLYLSAAPEIALAETRALPSATMYSRCI